MKKPTPKPKASPSDPLIGQFFHSINGQGVVEWQGCILGSPSPGWYYVQLYEWGFGEANVRRIVPFGIINNWLFYSTSDEMRHSYDHGVAREGGPYRKKPENTSPEKAAKFFKQMREAAQ